MKFDIDYLYELFLKSTGITTDSRNIEKGNIFFALKGDNKDGHNFVGNVFSKHIKLAVVNESWFRSHKDKFLNKPFILVPDKTLALGELAMNHRRKFSIPVIFEI